MPSGFCGFTLQEWTDPNIFNVYISFCKQFVKDYEALMKVQWRDFPNLSGYMKVASVEGNKGHHQRVAVKLQRVVQSFLLRGSKIHVEKQLPRKYDHTLTCTLSNEQKSMYEDILSQPRIQECLRSGHFVSILPVLTQVLRHADWSLFDVIGMEHQTTSYEAQILPKLKITRKLIEETDCSPSTPVKLKPNRQNGSSGCPALEAESKRTSCVNFDADDSNA
ncbi:E1A-binding protein p400-like [Strigops habroptila]|uniref:E1A-binding protein p400-like n=1 Tax=Strigops habroptila TaxID=2489341 RepID=UPI0011CF4D5B|nr:E1A-binding protein p400-like [Strigops habroptila]XP_030357756.1 E1A-binding protein p400-like [Strigops habroptila]